mmetsp:Transcript_37642/g.76611  ORF Transcript_37642/g.76611 Transcript_37642/m.76611 type:complete len:378 (+) Transcript_37642:396-1529(+)
MPTYMLDIILYVTYHHKKTKPKRQIQSDYGPSGITTYTQPVTQLSGSIMNKSNTNGGGRGSYRKLNGTSIIGDVINHGKRQYWDPSKSIHYHATLKAGENTLEAQLVRVLMKSIVMNKGTFCPHHFRNAYVNFMTTPGSHNDCYASTCHRMFFANMVFGKLPPEKCPDNDRHNVDTIDGLILPTVTALAYAARDDADYVDGGGADGGAADAASKTAAVTRNSSVLEAYSAVLSGLIRASVRNDDSVGIDDALQEAAKKFGLRQMPSGTRRDEMSACYLQGSVPTLLDMVAKYGGSSGGGRTGATITNDAWTGLLANANIGGENVHRGAVLGALLGARAGVENMPQELFDGLYDSEAIRKEIDDFVNAVLSAERRSEL